MKSGVRNCIDIRIFSLLIIDMKTIILIISFIFCFEVTSAQKDTTLVNININDIYDLNIKGGTCIIDFYQNTNSSTKTLPNIELMNGNITESYIANDYGKTKEKRVKALLRSNFNLKNYPFDNQLIQLILEPNKESDSLIFQANKDANIISTQSIHLPGWKVDTIYFTNLKMKYNLLRNGLKKDYYYDRVVFNVAISRANPFDYLIKSIFHNVLAILLISLALFHPVSELSLKNSLSVGSIFVLFTNFSQQLSIDAGIFTIIDEINLYSLLFVGYAVIIFTICYYLFNKRVKAFTVKKTFEENMNKAKWHFKRLELILFFTGLIIYLLKVVPMLQTK
jgi:hypothetical protein